MLLQSFITYLSHEKRYSPHTISSYSTDLKEFEIFIKATFELEFLEVKPTHIRSYMMQMMEEDFAEKSINRKISTLRSFYKFLVREEKADKNPAALIKAPKIPKRLPVFVDAIKMSKLLDSTEVFGEDFNQKRDHLVIEFLFGTGIRLAELLAIRDRDLNIYEHTIKVLGKGNKERIIPVTKMLSQEIQDFIATKKIQNFYNNSEALIVTREGIACLPQINISYCNRLLKLSDHE